MEPDIQRACLQYDKAVDLLSRIADFQLPTGKNGLPNVASIQPQIQISLLKGYDVTKVIAKGGRIKPIEECDRAQLFGVLRGVIGQARKLVAKVDAYYTALDAELLEISKEEDKEAKRAQILPFFPEGIPTNAQIEPELRYRDYEKDPGTDF